MFEDKYPAKDTKTLSDEARMALWKELLPVVAEHFQFNAADKLVAVESARAEPSRALTCYRAIVNSLRRD